MASGDKASIAIVITFESSKSLLPLSGRGISIPADNDATHLHYVSVSRRGGICFSGIWWEIATLLSRIRRV